MQNIITTTGTNWANYSILAHEIGHHLEGHTLDTLGGSKPPLELHADRFSGFIMAKLGATLSEAQVVMQNVASESGSSTHPPKSARLEAIAVGWRQANPNLPPDEPPFEPQIIPEQPVYEDELVTINFNYVGSAGGTNIQHQAEFRLIVGNYYILPDQNRFQMNVDPGSNYYQIQGNLQINLYGILYNVTAYGDGNLNAREGSNFNVQWDINLYTGVYYFYIE